MNKFLFRNKHRIILCITVAGFLATAASWTLAKSNTAPPQPLKVVGTDGGSADSEADLRWSKVILSVSNMTCGGCIATIKQSVAGVKGTGSVQVDLASATAEVLYDGNIISDPQVIANAIKDGGYPAKIQRRITSRQYRREMIEVTENAKINIAKVGRINIARKDFEIELDHARSRYQKIYGADTFSTPQGKQLLQQIQTQITRRLVDEAIKNQEVDKAGFTIKDGSIDQALLEYTNAKNITLDQLKSDLEANGYPFDHFKKKFGQRVKLQRYLEEEILTGSIDPDDSRQRYGNWLSNARSLAKVVYYDKSLEALAKSGSGGGCSGGGSGGCSVSR